MTTVRVSHVLDHPWRFDRWAVDVAHWLQTVVSLPRPDLGRSGALCPYVPPAIDADGLTMSFEPEVSRDALHAAATAAARDFLATAEADNARGRLTMAHLLVLPTGAEAGPLLTECRETIKAALLETGLTCGEFYDSSTDASVRNAEALIARSPWPLLAIRFSTPHDELFLAHQPELLSVFHAAGPGSLRCAIAHVSVTDEYFVVGPTLVLSGPAEPRSPELNLQVSRGGAVNGMVTAVLRRGILEIDVAGLASDGSEAARLLARIAVKRFSGELRALRILRRGDMLDRAHRDLVEVDGFVTEPDGSMLSHRLRFIRSEHERADRMAGVYTDELTIPWNFVPVEKDVVDRLLSETLNDGHVLDLGCGFGKNAQYLATHRRQVSGIDIAANAIARMALEVPAVSATRASADRLPFADETFDGVLDVGCLHSADVEVRQPIVREVARVLKLGRVLVSRIFRPRSAEWLEAQPFRTSGFGLEAEDAERLLLSGFTNVQVDVDPDFTILTARGRR